jgi:hypothetical protein
MSMSTDPQERDGCHPADGFIFSPGVEYRVVNDSDRGCEMYSVRWGEELTQRFAARHRSEG